MARSQFAVVLLAAALVVASGARMPLQAAAPAPAMAANGADVLFTMEAQQATFTDAQTLTLSGLTGSAQSFAVGGKTAVYPIAAFIGAQFVNAAGEWLGNPQAVFYGVNAQGNLTTAILALSSPKESVPTAGVTNNNNNNNNNGGTITNNNNNGQTLSFTVAAVAADPAQVKMPGGAVSAKVSEAASGAANIVSAITPGAQFTNIVLFIDTNQQTMTKVAETKWGWGGWFPNYYDNGYNGGWSSSNNNNNNNNNGGYGANNNNNNNNNGGYGANNNNNNNNNNGGYGANNNNNNNNNGGYGANNNNNNNNNGRH